MELTEGWWDDIIAPFLKFLFATFIAAIPAGICGGIVGAMTPGGIDAIIANPGPLMVASVAASAFVWPMVCLSIHFPSRSRAVWGPNM